MTIEQPTRSAGLRRARMALLITASALAALDLGLKAWVKHGLSNGRSIDLGWLQLRLLFNQGFAFGLGGALPGVVVLAVTGLMVVVLAVFALRSAGTSSPWTGLALAVVLGGAISNLADRAADGVVTDYLHTGWFPTFNGADVFITVGVAALLLTTLRPPAKRRLRGPG